MERLEGLLVRFFISFLCLCFLSLCFFFSFLEEGMCWLFGVSLSGEEETVMGYDL